MKYFFITIISAIVITSCASKAEYIKSEGLIFGTSYHFTYQSNSNYDILISDKLKQFDKSLNTYDSTSVISLVNKNVESVGLDDYFLNCFNRSVEISDITTGAFDMTVAPVVNAWGFGTDRYKQTNTDKIDSLMQYVGYKNIKLVDGAITKNHKETTLDASAIAKGYGVDVVSELLEDKGVKNYMVEIGGEVRAKGKNAKGVYWRIGIDKPVEDAAPSRRTLQAIVNVNNKSLATSGNYRQFYEKDGVKYSHTIDPKTGYPARNSLLSASVLADDCMTADAFATAFMVLGIDKSIELANKLDYLDVYFIYTDTLNNYNIYSSKGFERVLSK